MPVEVPSFQELYDLGKAAALLRTSRLREESFQSGFMADVLTGMSAAQVEEVVRFALELHARTFVRTAAGDALDELAEDHYSLPRRQAAGAVGKVRFLRSSVAAGPCFIEIGTRVATDTGIVFRTLYPVVMDGLSIFVDVIAEVAGLAGMARANTVMVIVDPVTDPSVTVSNPERMAGASDAETDDQYRARIREYLATLRRGTVAALAFGAKIAGVLQATVDDTAYPPTVYIADQGDVEDGEELGNDVLVANVEAELENWRAAGVQVNVAPARVALQPITVVLSFEAGVDTGGARDAAIESILAEVGKIGIGQTLYRSALIAAAKRPGIRNVVISNPAGDVIPDADELVRTRSELITIGVGV